jgi:hypothetical protein
MECSPQPSIKRLSDHNFSGFWREEQRIKGLAQAVQRQWIQA